MVIRPGLFKGTLCWKHSNAIPTFVIEVVLDVYK